MSTQVLPKSILVGICGHKSSGKDTVAKLLKNHFAKDYHCVRLAFADALKQRLAQLTGGNIETINAQKNDPVLRYILQWLGQKVKETDGELVWVNEVARIYKAIQVKAAVFVTDVRFPFEADWIKEQGGVVIRVFRPLADLRVDNHPSETEVDRCKFDWGIRNDGSLRDLERDVKWTSQFIKEKYKIV
jgi:hypothetical protein